MRIKIYLSIFFVAYLFIFSASCVSTEDFKDYTVKSNSQRNLILKEIEAFENELVSIRGDIQELNQRRSNEGPNCKPSGGMKDIALNYILNRSNIDTGRGFTLGEEQVIHVEPYSYKGKPEYAIITMEIYQRGITGIQDVFIRLKHSTPQFNHFGFGKVKILYVGYEPCFDFLVEVLLKSYEEEKELIAQEKLVEYFISKNTKLDVELRSNNPSLQNKFGGPRICKVFVN